jgi:hypothetical protein
VKDTEVAARVAIAALQARYITCVDQNRASEVAGLFVEDGVLDSRVMGRECHGRAEIAAYIEGLRSWAHVSIHTSPADVAFSDESHAEARSYFTVLAAAGLDHWGVYVDELVSDGESWQFARRTIELVGTAQHGWLGSPDRADSAAVPGQ